MEREKNENTIRMIQELTDAAGASGFEDEVILTAKKYGEEFAQTEEDCLRNLYLYRRKNTGNKPVMYLLYFITLSAVFSVVSEIPVCH